MSQNQQRAATTEPKPISAAPSISLPKGGGTIRGIGETFAANPVTGTGAAIPTPATYDHISRNRFVSRSAHHHGYLDGRERDFRNFGIVEQRKYQHIHEA